MEYAYLRVSGADQCENRQVDALSNLKISQSRIFIDKVSGKDFNRPAYKTLIRKLKPGDLLYVCAIDRLGRNYAEILENWRLLTKVKGVDIVVLDMLPLLDTRNGNDLMGTFVADMVLSLLSFMAEKERDNIRQRQAAGIAAARARGLHLGRPMEQVPKNFAQVVRLWEHKEIDFKEALRRTGLKQATFYNRLREFRGRNKK